MKSLYRRYRPTSLGEVVGQPQVTEPLLKSLKAGKISHAYLFIGPRGCGKTSVARILAHEVNDFKYEIEDDYVDIIEIDGASNRGIDNIRDLREKVMIAPTTGKYKIYIIDEVHMLTKEAFNALLKTLEEPPKHAIFIMATTDAYKVPVTITSRAQVYTFKLASFDTMMDFLKSVIKKEKIKITEDALAIIIKRGGGSFRDTLSLLDQLSTLSDDEITKEMVVSAMGLPQDEQINELLNEYANGSVVNITTILKELISAGVKVETLAEEIITSILENPKPELLPLLNKMTDVRAPFAEAKLLVALMPNQPKFVTPKEIKKENVEEAPGFNWNSFLSKVKSTESSVGKWLEKTRHEIDGDSLNIYTSNKTILKILTRHKSVLTEAADGNVKITINNETSTPKETKKDAAVDILSDIMRGEVKDDGGKNPFEE